MGVSSPRKTLIITPPPSIFGGVAAKARLMAETLASRGHTVTIAHYATLSEEPELTGCVRRLLTGGRPTTRHYLGWNGMRFVSVGCWLPELEATYYADSPLWRDLIRDHDRHIAIGGTVLVASPLVASQVPHLIWCASDMLGDRIDRQRAMPFYRRVFDRSFVVPIQRRMERRILSGGGHVMAVSHRAVAAIRSASPNGSAQVAHLPIPTDVSRFHPPSVEAAPGVIGFAGRLSDPRKNVSLLLEAAALVRPRGADVRVRLAGEIGPQIERQAAELGLGSAVEFVGRVPDEALPDFYRSLDVFVIPSWQEGLNICGIEALASGVPVITTPCGGPQDYVRDGTSGFVSGFDPAELADDIVKVVSDRELRARLSSEARTIAEREYGMEDFNRRLDVSWREVWGEALDAAKPSDIAE